jgi:diguanylate cyclase
MFEYLKGDNIEISKAFNIAFEKKTDINEHFLLRLYSTILSYDTMARTVDTVSSMLTAQIIGLNDSVSSSDQELNVFSHAIDSFSQRMESNEDSNIITYIVEATGRVKAKIKELEGNLDASQSEIKKLQTYLDNIRQESMIDPLTSIGTRKRFDQVLSKSIRSSLENKEKVSVAFMEIDHYDAFKDKWGQVTSEQILRFAASTLKENIKGRDTAARYSESLFALILPKTDSHGGKILAEYIRNIIERKRIVKKTTGEFLGRTTISVGIAEFQEGESIGHLVSRAEKILNIARMNGRNCTINEEDAKKLMTNDNLGQTGS